MCARENKISDIADIFYFQCLSQKNGHRERNLCFRKRRRHKRSSGYIKHRVTNKRKASMEATLAVMAFVDGDYDVVARALTLWSSKRACKREDLGSHNYFSADIVIRSEGITVPHINPDQETETIANEVEMAATYKRIEVNLAVEVDDAISSSAIGDYGSEGHCISKCVSVSEIFNLEHEDGNKEGIDNSLHKLKIGDSITFEVKTVVKTLGKRKANADLLETHRVGLDDGAELSSMLWRMEERLRLESNAFNLGHVLDESPKRGAMFRMVTNYLIMDFDTEQGLKMSIMVGDEQLIGRI